jgi:hypothetical protein
LGWLLRRPQGRRTDLPHDSTGRYHKVTLHTAFLAPLTSSTLGSEHRRRTKARHWVDTDRSSAPPTSQVARPKRQGRPRRARGQQPGHGGSYLRPQPFDLWGPKPRRIATRAVVGPRDSGQQRSTKVPTDNQTGGLSAVIGRDGAAGPYMACKGSDVSLRRRGVAASRPACCGDGRPGLTRHRRPESVGGRGSRPAADRRPLAGAAARAA